MTLDHLVTRIPRCALLALLSGCSVLVSASERQCDTTDECVAKGSGYENTECSAEGFCVRKAGPLGGCTSNAQCSTDLQAPAICREPGAPCTPLLLTKSIDGKDVPICTEVVGDITSDSTVVLGWIAPTAVLEERRPYITLALKELNREGVGIPGGKDGGGRFIAFVYCNEQSDGTGNPPTTAYEHLIKTVGAPAIMGPNPEQLVIPIVLNEAKPNNVMVLTRTGSPQLNALADNQLLWSMSYSIDYAIPGLAKLMQPIEQAVRQKYMLTSSDMIRVAILNTASTGSEQALEDLLANMTFNGMKASDQLGTNLKRYDFTPGCSDQTCLGDTLTDIVSSFHPHVLYHASALEGPPLTGVIENALQAFPTAPKPVYVFYPGGTADGGNALISVIKGQTDPEDLRSRVFGVSSAIDTQSSAYTRLGISFYAAYKASPNPVDVIHYDSVYALALATVAAGKVFLPGGDQVAAGMLHLVGSAQKYELGSDKDLSVALSILDNAGTIDIVGTSGALDFDKTTGTAPSDFAMWCVQNEADGSYALKVDYHDNYALYQPGPNTLTMGPGCD